MNDEVKWNQQFEDPEIKDSPLLSRYESPEKALKGYLELEAWKGRAIRLPGEESSAEEISEFVEKAGKRVPGLVVMPKGEDQDDIKRFWKDLGTPDDADGYEPPADIDAVDENFVGELRKFAHHSGLTNEQFGRFLGKFAEAQGQLAEQQQQAAVEEEQRLKQSWGSAYEQNMAVTDKLIEKFSDDKVKPENVSNAHRLMLMNVAKAFKSDSEIGEQFQQDNMRKTPAEIREHQRTLFKQLTDRSVTGDRRKRLSKEYEGTFEELARYGG